MTTQPAALSPDVPKTTLDAYLSHPAHRRWQTRYAEYRRRDRTHFLLFKPEWAEEWLPPENSFTSSVSSPVVLRAVLLDTENGTLYKIKMDACYSGGREPNAPPWRDEQTRSLHPPFYSEHCCACHRKAAAETAGADTDAECEGERFQIECIEAPDLPGLVLYSETMSREDLERMIPVEAPADA